MRRRDRSVTVVIGSNLARRETLNRFLSGHSCAFLKLDGLKGDVEAVWLYLLPPRVANTPPISAIHFLDMVPDLDGANGFENIAYVFCVFYKVRPVCPGAPSLFQVSSPPFDTLAHLYSLPRFLFCKFTLYIYIYIYIFFKLICK